MSVVYTKALYSAGNGTRPINMHLSDVDVTEQNADWPIAASGAVYRIAMEIT